METKQINIIGYPIQKPALTVIFLILFFLFLTTSCTSEEHAEEAVSGVSLQMKSVSTNLLSNTQLYVFANDHKFIRKQLNISRNQDRLFTIMEAGYLNLVVLGCEEDISENITQPPSGILAGQYPMWKTPLKSDGEFLEQTPEIRYAALPVHIEENVTKSASAILNRNVARIQVILKDYNGFDEISGTHPLAYTELLDIPTTIMWDGKLSLASENISEKPLREMLSFDSEGKADTVNFIVPAHLSSTIADTITHKLRLKMSMPINNIAFHGKTPIEIPYTPQPNRNIQLVVTFRGEPPAKLDIQVSVKDWEDYIIQEETFD